MEPPKQRERLRFVASSGERRPRRASSLGIRIAVLTAGLLAALVTLFQVIGPGHRSSPVDADVAATTPTATASPTGRPPTPTATPTALEMASEWITVEPRPTDTPTPLPTATPRPPQLPTPTPTVAQCVSLRWSASQSTATLGQVLISAELTNHCNRNLRPLEVWVSVAGYRQGALVQSAHGHPFDIITPGHSEDVTIGLPGSLDWYDHLSIEVGDQPEY